MSRRLGRDHPYVEIGARLNLPVVNVEAMREGDCGALLYIRLDFRLVYRGDVLVRHEHHDNIRTLYRFGDFRNFESRVFRFVPGRPALAQANRNLDA